MDAKDWKAFLYNTMTGSVGPEIQVREGTTMTLSLSGNSGGYDFELDKYEMPDLSYRNWLEDWANSVVCTFQGRAIYAGEIIGKPQETNQYIKIETDDIRAILARRITISEEAVYSNSIGSHKLYYNGLSLGTIAQEVVKVALAKPNGTLPIHFASPRESVANDADHERTYKSYNMGTLTVDEVLTKLSEVTQGPDIFFKPRMVNDSQFRWDMLHGTENDYRIRQTNNRIPQFDLHATRAQASSLSIVATAAHMTNRAFVVGEGTNEATVIGMRENLQSPRRGFPLLESVSSGITTENVSVLRNHATQRITQNEKSLKEITLFVEAYGDYPLGTYWPGDLINLHMEGYEIIPDGRHDMRLLAMQPKFGGQMVRLSLQLDDQWYNN